MTDSDKDAMAAMVEERWVDFQAALSDSKRRYPSSGIQEIRSSGSKLYRAQQE